MHLIEIEKDQKENDNVTYIQQPFNIVITSMSYYMIFVQNITTTLENISIHHNDLHYNNPYDMMYEETSSIL